MQEKYNVTGMTCAACQARVQKSVYGVVRLRSTSGINVEMHISNIQKGRDFDMLIR